MHQGSTKLLALVCLAVAVAALLQTASASPTTCPKACKCRETVLECSSLVYVGKMQVTILKLNAGHKTVSLEAGQLTNLGMQGLIQLHVSNAQIQFLDEAAFADLADLHMVTFVDCALPPLSEKTFENAKVLRTLLFNRVTFDTSLYSAMRSSSLEEIILNNCHIEALNEHMFDAAKLPSLLYVNLASNKIDRIDDEIFANTLQLERIDLSHNNLVEIKESVFINCVNLMSVVLNNNPRLSKIRFGDEVPLEILEAESCNLDHIPDTLDFVSTLKLKNNKITKIDAALMAKMVDLEELSVVKNQIQHLDGNEFSQNENLLYLDLDDNPIGNLPVFDVSVMATFSCRRCGIKSLTPATFTHMNVVKLDLSHNQIASITTELRPLSNLKNLNLANNSIEDIAKDAFQMNAQLMRLDLSHNSLAEISPELFRHNARLKTLDVSHNELHNLWYSPTMNVTLLQLQSIDYAFNPLLDLCKEDLSVTPNLKYLSIQNTTLPCSRVIEVVPLLNSQNVQAGTLKDHEPLMQSATYTNPGEPILSWKAFVAEKCTAQEYRKYEAKWNELKTELSEGELPDEYEYSDEELAFAPEKSLIEKPVANYDIDEVHHLADDETLPNDIEDEEDEDEDEDDEDEDVSQQDDMTIFKEDAGLVQAIENFPFADGESYRRMEYFWPSIFFLGTCMLVLVCGVCLFLAILKRRNVSATSQHRPLYPAMWGAHNRILKRHQGSVYKQLTEELPSGAKTPIISRAAIYIRTEDTPGVHHV